jgi:geranylgeranyl pyrophosphate synthase
MVANGTPEQLAALEHYGFNLGLAFQIVDDILDLIADSKTLGKTAGIDVSQGKGLAMAIATGNGKPATATTAVVDVDAGDPLASFKQKMLTGGYIEEGRQQAQQLAMLAAMSLDVLPASAARDEMLALTRQVIERDH